MRLGKIGWMILLATMGGVGLLLVSCIAGCGTWLNDTRAGLLSANAALNSYDDVAVEVWEDAPTNPESQEQLGTSLCASYIVQDSLIEGWAIATMVDDGIKKKRDFTQWAGNTLTVLDALEDFLEMSGVKIPHQLGLAIAYIEAMNPKGVLPPDSEPFEGCADILAGKHPMAGNVPTEALIGAAADLGVFILNIVLDRLADKSIPEDALEETIRDVFKQAVLYEQGLGGE